MANVFFKKGLLANLPSSYAAGTFYVTTDERAMYLDIDDSTRIRLGDFIQVDAVANLPTAGASTSALYYCVSENVLAKWNGSSWTQINKQPTADEMKTLLGLGAMAYKSEVAEGDLNSDLAAKINAASGAQHTHTNESVLNGITAEKVADWDDAVSKEHTHSFSDEAALNGITAAKVADWDDAVSKEHTHTFVDSDVEDAISKKHSHTFLESELNKIVDGDVAKWNGVAADHLTSADKTTLENAIKEAKKAGTDANTNIETYKVANDARVLAVEEDIAEIVDGENGILAQAKSYTDGKDSAMNTRVAALESAAPTHATKDELNGVDSKFANYNTKVEQKAIDDAQDAEIAKKVDKVEGKSLISDSEIARLATLANYDDTQVKADIAKKADSEAMAVELGKKVDKVDGKDLISTSEIERLTTLHNYDDTALAGRVTTAEGKISSLEGASATHATKTELQEVDSKFANYKTYADQKVIDDEQDRRLGVIEGDYLKAADIANFETKENVKKVADDLAEYVESNDEALAGVKAIAEAARTESEVDGQIDAKISALNLGTTYEPIGAEQRAKDYADGLISDANLDQYTTEQEVKDIVDTVIAGAVDGDTITGLANLVEYLNTHGAEAKEMGAAIDVLEGKVETIEGKPAYGITATQISNWDGEVGAKALAESKTTTAEVKDQIEAYGYATTGYADGKASDAQSAAEAKAAELDAALKAELQGEIDEDVKVVSDDLAGYKTSNNAAVALKANAADVYAKSETFTKDEVNAAIAAAVEAAHTWGEF